MGAAEAEPQILQAERPAFGRERPLRDSIFAQLNFRSWPNALIDYKRPNGRSQSWADLQLFMFDRLVVAGLRPSSRGAGAVSGRAFENPQVQVLVLRWTAPTAVSDSAPHAVHDGRRPFWFVAIRWLRHAGMTHLTRRPLPSHRRRMPSCL
jgi:hypothetical protein